MLLLFVAIIAYSNQTKIQNQLFDGKTVNNQLDIIAKVFEQKKTILKDFCIGFGDYKGTIWTIEYQKRGFPYMHYLLFLFQDIYNTSHNFIDCTV